MTDSLVVLWRNSICPILDDNPPPLLPLVLYIDELDESFPLRFKELGEGFNEKKVDCASFCGILLAREERDDRFELLGEVRIVLLLILLLVSILYLKYSQHIRYKKIRKN